MDTQHHTQTTGNIEKMHQVSGLFCMKRYARSHGMKHSEKKKFERIKCQFDLAPYDYINRFPVRQSPYRNI